MTAPHPDPDGVARLELDRPEHGNTLTREVVADLADRVQLARADPGTRVLLIAARGDVFSHGGDIAEFLDGDLSTNIDSFVTQYHRLLAQIAELPVPVVVQARGMASGGALGLLWVADLVLVDTTFALTTGAVRVGLSGDGGSSWWLPRLVGERRACELLLLARVVKAEEAHRLGLVTTVAQPDDLDQQTQKVLSRLAGANVRAVQGIKRLLAQPQGDLGTHLELERQEVVACARQPEVEARLRSL